MASIFCTSTQQHKQNVFFQSNPRELLGQQVVVLDKFKVDKELFDRVCAQLDAIRPNLIECENYTFGELLGEDFLANLSDTESRLAILCVEHLADQTGSNLADKRGSGSHLEFLWTGQ